MAFNIKELTENLEISDQRLKELQEQVVESFDDENKLKTLISQQCLDQEETGCLSCNDEGDCAILNGIIYIKLNNINHAITELEKAKRCLGGKYETWNRIVGLVLLGIAHENSYKNYLALREYKHAYEVLKNIYLRVHANDYIKKGKLLVIELSDKLTKLSTSSLSPVPLSEIELPDKAEKPSTQNSSYDPPKTNSANINPSHLFHDDRDYLALFSIPIFGTVEAGLDGRLHVDPFNIFTIINQVELKKQIFDVYNIHGTADSDHQITITTKREHGWLRVHGLSMNGWDLPFNENDYVLFYKSPTASHFDYVIASNTDPSGEISLMVKRYDAEKNQLLSKSIDTSKPYAPIPVDDNHQIIGIVIAVAKPAK
jgi:tetratricopeptide (TPR) repeat protein